MIKLQNTLTGQLDTLQPVGTSVKIYTCGPTVYSEPTVGNWVPYIRWDLLIRTLRASGYETDRFMNITDVGHLTSDADEGEDKMEKGARREGVSAWEIAERYTNDFMNGMEVLRLVPPEKIGRATEHIADQIALIERLEAGRHTYQTDDGVYFDTATFPTYADFAHLDVAGLRSGARVEANSQKRNATDFALWKKSPTGSKRDMEWESPWGTGFPGWHIECSAMAMRYLGKTLDIHTGGIDHIPVHHTNEIAQSEAATGVRFANIWLHTNFLLVDGTKISKSLGNVYTLADLGTKGFNPLAFKLFVLQSHYRSESNFTWDNLAHAAARLKQWRSVAALRHQTPQEGGDAALSELFHSGAEAGLHALQNDLGSPEAIVKFESGLSVAASAALESINGTDLEKLVQIMDDTFGLDILQTTPDIDAKTKATIQDRLEARRAKDWTRSDELREELEKSGIGLNDGLSGTTWFYL